MNIKSLANKYQLNDSEKNILTFINNHKNNDNLTIRYVAKNNYCSTGFIINLCKKMGFSGYSEFIYYATAAKNKTFELKNDNIILKYGNTFAKLLNLHKKDKIIVIGEGLSQHIAGYISDSLNIKHFLATSTRLYELLSKKSLVIIISNSGETASLIQFAQVAKHQNADIISLCGNNNSKLANLATLNISTDTNSAYSYQDYYPQLFFGTVLTYFELFSYKTKIIIFT